MKTVTFPNHHSFNIPDEVEWHMRNYYNGEQFWKAKYQALLAQVTEMERLDTIAKDNATKDNRLAAWAAKRVLFGVVRKRA